MLLPVQFFLGSKDEELKPVLEQLKELLYNASSSMIIGPTKCGKSTLLFQYAYQSARQGQVVWYICSKKKLHSSIPLFQTLYEPDPTVLKRITIK